MVQIGITLPPMAPCGALAGLATTTFLIVALWPEISGLVSIMLEQMGFGMAAPSGQELEITSEPK